MRDLLAAYGPEQFVPVSWYITPPYSIPESIQRNGWYGAQGTPDAWFDGIVNSLGGGGATMFPVYNPIVASRLGVPSPLEVDAVYRMTSATAGTLYVDILVTGNITTTNNVVQCVIVEDDVGAEHEINLARDVLPEESFTLTTPGQTLSFERPYTLSGSWNSDNIGYVVFVQSEAAGKQVLQAAWAKIGRGIDVDPGEELYAVGEPGGPFSPSSIVYTVENLGPETIDYTVTSSATWLSVTNATGTLTGHGSAEVTVALNAEADALGKGVYTSLLSFVNDTDHWGDTTLNAYLQVGTPELVHSFNMDTDPGWTTEGLWEHGQPTGGGGSHGSPDPTSGFTGDNVYGYNLYGDYENNLPETHLTTTAIDCSDMSLTSLRFQRWLGVHGGDHGYVRVSTDLSNWTEVWASSGTVNDAGWTQVEYDLSAVADGESTVYIRWTMGPTDSSWQYCGWNIDDVEIWGIWAGDSGIDDGELPLRTALLSNYPNPFNPTTTIAFEIPTRTQVSLRVYDVSGRLVQILEDSEIEAGRHTAVWDGKDRDGKSVASGVYFCRLEAGSVTDTRTMVLLK
jgi:hypothetical protein